MLLCLTDGAGCSSAQVERLLCDDKGKAKYKCPGAGRRGHVHKSVQEDTNKSVRFHPHLAASLAIAINRSMEME